ncbi:MAG: sel1 repeat family protein [Alphaproteobacteria bacterium]|nr:sel1 repeat family protein [Alphaproteobacteria bacterium]
MKTLFYLFVFFKVSSALAFCPMGELYQKAGRAFDAWSQYQACADENNDASSQLYVGQVYLDGNSNVQQSLNMALRYFRMASENGYAPAQRKLAILMQDMEELGDMGVKALESFEDAWRQENNSDRKTMSALSWMMLAAEKPENKWFYFSENVLDKEAVQLLPQMKSGMSPEQIEMAQKSATAWKQEQLLKQAKFLLDDTAYEDFKQIIYPDKNVKTKISRAQAVEELRKYKMSKRK